MLLIKKTALDSTPSLVFLRNKRVLLRSISSIADTSSTKSPNPHSFKVSYLINSCGLPPETAISVSPKLNFETPEKPDSVLNLLRTHGFTQTQISILVRKRPQMLLANPDKTLLPKIEFFQSLGISRTDLARSLSSTPALLGRSLDNQIVPCYNYLKSVLQSDKKVVAAMNHTHSVFLKDLRKYLLPNIDVLREIRVPESSIAYLLNHFPEAIMENPNRFNEVVNEVKEMGFDPLKMNFVQAVHAISGDGNKLIWSRCYKAYKKWGWSEDDILSAFRKHPNCMLLSEKKISQAMDVFVNKMGRHSKEIARCPANLAWLQYSQKWRSISWKGYDWKETTTTTQIGKASTVPALNCCMTGDEKGRTELLLSSPLQLTQPLPQLLNHLPRGPSQPIIATPTLPQPHASRRVRERWGAYGSGEKG
ncbi:mitochondrial transcription termination factor family protein [Actinidia rufa]|uniref:Mitochondrial transcription termination factor family protein n=1 Tax=Actinidia rufa TaxID=165716 RepID=A0A7J0G1H5_9ERIC|nr:mitochondrial transcription termination factor family protein [Actinidia rufa]